MITRTTKFVPRQFLYDAPRPRLSAICKVVSEDDWVEVEVVESAEPVDVTVGSVEYWAKREGE